MLTCRKATGCLRGQMPQARPGRPRDARHGPIPLDNRYGRSPLFTVWFTPKPRPVRLLHRDAGERKLHRPRLRLGAVPSSSGPCSRACSSRSPVLGTRTGVGQIPLRACLRQDGDSSGLLQWASCTAWDAINASSAARRSTSSSTCRSGSGWRSSSYFRASWGSGLRDRADRREVDVDRAWHYFLVITIKIIDIGKVSTPNAAHGGALVGASC